MDTQDRKYKIKETFNAAAAGYDKPALRFFKHTAEHLAQRMEFSGTERVLDVATGTGAVALACARRLGAGHVTGIDLSEGMLAQARAKAAAEKLGNLTLQCMDLEALDLGADTFDAACCGFGIFFLPDMEAGLKIIAQHVKPGAAIGISSFTGEVMEPLSQKFLDRIQSCGVSLPPLSWKRLDTPEKLHALYRAAGLEQPLIYTEQVGYPLTGFDEWWDLVWHSGFRGLVSQLAPDDLARFTAAHREEIEALADSDGIELNVNVLIAVGRKPIC